MNRRSFLGLLGGLGAASATSYFFAPIGGWKSDVIAQPRWHVTETSPGEFTTWIDDPGNERCIKEAMGLDTIQQRMNRSMDILNAHFAEMKAGYYAPRGNGYPQGVGSWHT